MNFLFVGERPSPTAHARGFSWQDGRLAAKQLFDALRACQIDPASQKFDNVFLSEPQGPEVVCDKAIRRIRAAQRGGSCVVAMGKKAEMVLTTRGITCLSIVHPAARGRIRKKELYCAHVREALLDSFMRK